MPQYPIGYTFKDQAGYPVPGQLDMEGVSILAATGLSTALNVTSATVIKTGRGRLVRIVVISGGTTANGQFTLNDAATVGGATTANQVYTLLSGAAAGTVVTLDLPVVNGIVVSAVPTAGAPKIAVVYT